MMLSKDFKEFVELLNKNNVKYLVIDGYAVALHGYPRYTKDLDYRIDLSLENAESILKALEQFGFGSLDLDTDDFLAPDKIIQLGHPPNRIDLITTAKGLNFEECYKSRVKLEIQNIQIDFIDMENLKRNKRATGRPQDFADLENLK
ncbi:hypothetical protein ACFL7E_01040 [Thermodesulfobacteriota bacterium]